MRVYFSDARTLMQQGIALQYGQPLAVFVEALNGTLPVSVTVHGADEIAVLLRLQREFGFRLIIHGGAEAHLVAPKLAAATPPVAVVLTSRVPPSTFETFRVRDDALTILQQAGVQWAIQAASEDNARNLRWEGGWQRRYNPSLTGGQIIAGRTVNVKRIFGVSGDAATATEWARGVGEVEAVHAGELCGVPRRSAGCGESCAADGAGCGCGVPADPVLRRVRKSGGCQRVVEGRGRAENAGRDGGKSRLDNGASGSASLVGMCISCV